MDNTNAHIALLIDSDNISPRYIETVFDELKSIGTVTVKRIYGDWTRDDVKSWKAVLPEYAIQPMQQFANTVGKNSTDSAMIIDAMDILYRDAVEVFCLATSDSDFTRLAVRLRESGKQVLGMGESKTPKSFVNACDSFRYLDVLSGRTDDTEASQENSITPREEIEQEVLAMLSRGEVGARVQISMVKANLQRKFPDFDERNYGYSKFSGFLQSFSAFKLVMEGTHNFCICQEPSGERAEVEDFVKDLLQKNAGKKINIGEINKRITDHFRGFSVKAYGYKQIKLFLSDIPGVKIKDCDVTYIM